MMSGLMSLTVQLDESTPVLTEKLLLEALYRTMAKNSRMCCCVQGLTAVPLGKTLADLHPNFRITKVERGTRLCDLQEEFEESLNTFFDRDKMGWAMVVFMPDQLDATQAEIHLGITMLHLLTDGFGLVTIGRQYAESLTEAMQDPSPLDRATPVPDHCPISDDHHYILKADSLPPLLWVVLAVYRVLMALRLLLVLISGMLFVLPYSEIWSGSKDPAETLVYDKTGRPVGKTSGYRLIQFDQDQVERMRLASRRAKGTVTSLLAMAALSAFNSLTQDYVERLPKKYSFMLATNTRPFVHEPLKMMPLLQGGSTHIKNEYNYAFSDHDSFWGHVKKYKDSVHFEMSFISPMICILSNAVPAWLSSAVATLRKVHHKRSMPLLLSNVGLLSAEQMNWTNRIKVTDIIGSASGFWNVNASVFQLTSITLNGKMNVAIIYPPYMVEDQDADRFVKLFKQVVENVLVDPYISVGTARSRPVSMAHLKEE
ncbi:hypothetical protein HDU91_001023 [Kappamyces sp. JEL0680]|nr:hypothetical protein HDU91_001023 [Kappamyces sp. JEL0680]